MKLPRRQLVIAARKSTLRRGIEMGGAVRAIKCCAHRHHHHHRLRVIIASTSCRLAARSIVEPKYRLVMAAPMVCMARELYCKWWYVFCDWPFKPRRAMAYARREK
jgi:hypothetical protein